MSSFKNANELSRDCLSRDCRTRVVSFRMWEHSKCGKQRKKLRLVEAAIPTFARHETFHPRYGWFRKAYEAAAEDPTVFALDDAPVRLGVGKNMVRSIRFWGLAAKLLIEAATSLNSRSGQVAPTRFAHALFGPSGWDPFLEDTGTLWLLHWRLLSPPCRLPVWWLAFNDANAGEFTEEDLLSLVISGLDAAADWKAPSPNSVKRDVSALLRTYGPAPTTPTARVSIDDILDCPMRELRLITNSSISGNYKFATGAKATPPAEIVAFASLDSVLRGRVTAQEITVSRLASEAGGAGKAFRLSEADLLDALEKTAAANPHLNLSASLGTHFPSWSIPPQTLADHILGDYYGNRQHCGISGPEGDLSISDELLDELETATPKYRKLPESAKPDRGMAA